MPAPRPRQISDILPKIQNVAQTSQFLVKFALPNGGLRRHLRRRGVNDRFVGDDVGLLCSDAVLPGSALATINTAGDYQGVIERFAHTRNFTQINFEFYVDNEYKSLKFLEHWMDYTTFGSEEDPSGDAYYFRMNYPSLYKSNETRVVKFERDHNKFIEYRFIGMFPINLTSLRVSYNNSQVLKATCTFSFDRYICGESSSLARLLGKAFNLNNTSGGGYNPDKGDTNIYTFNNKLNAATSGTQILNSNTNVIRDADGYLRESTRSQIVSEGRSV